MNTVTTQEIQGKISDSADTKIRKAWVAQLSEETKARIKTMPKPSRTALYKTFDSEVHVRWVLKLKEHRDNALANGVKMVRVAGFYRLPDEYCDKTDQFLIDAASEVITEYKHI